MTKEVELADGTIIEFDDDTPDEVIDDVIKRDYVKNKEPEGSWARDAIIAAKSGASGVLGGAASIPAMAGQAALRVPGWTAQGAGKLMDMVGADGSLLREAGASANERVANYTKELTGKDFYLPTSALSDLIDKALPEYKPRTVDERAIALGAETLGSLYGPNAVAKALTAAKGGGEFANSIARFGVNGGKQTAAAILGSGGAALGEYSDDPFVKAVLPIAGFLAPSALGKAVQGGARLGGKALRVTPESIKIAEDAGLPLSIFNASENPRVRAVFDHLSDVIGGSKLNQAKAAANAAIDARAKELMAVTDVTREAAGRVAQSGLAKSLKRELGASSAMIDKAWNELPENVNLSKSNIGNYLDEVVGKVEGKGKLDPAITNYISKNKIYKLADDLTNNPQPVITDELASAAFPIQERITGASTQYNELVKAESQLQSSLKNNAGLSDVSGIKKQLDEISQAKQQIELGLAKDTAELDSLLSSVPATITPQSLRVGTRIAREASQAAGDDIQAATTKRVAKGLRGVSQGVFEEVGGEALENFNKGNSAYRAAKAKEELLGDVLGEPSVLGRRGSRTVAPEDAISILHDDLLKRPTKFNEAMGLLSPRRQQYVMKYNIQKLGGGEAFNPLEYADNVMGNKVKGGVEGLAKDSRKALYASTPGLQEATEAYLKGVQRFRGVAGVAGQAKRSGAFVAGTKVGSALGLAGVGNFVASIPGVGWALGGGIGANKVLSSLMTNPNALKAMAGLNRVSKDKFPLYTINQMGIIKGILEKSDDIPENEKAKVLEGINKEMDEMFGDKVPKLAPLNGEESRLPSTERMIKSESGGDPNAQNPISSASGILQYTDATWNNAIKKYPELGLTIADKNNPEGQMRLTDLLTTKEYIPALEKNNLPVDDASIYAMHHFGQQSATRLLKRRNSEVKAAALVPADVVNSNPDVFYENGRARSAKEVVEWLSERLG